MYFVDGHDNAILGVGNGVVIYDRDQIISNLAEWMTYDEAMEYFEYNIAGAYLGEGTPIYLDRMGREEIECYYS